MSADTSSVVLLEIPGAAADHLYREGSKKASFWEVLFGSSLAGRKRTHVSARPDGARVFDIPTASLEEAFFKSAIVWFARAERLPEGEPALHALDAKTLRVKLTGIQPQGSAVAAFALRLVSVAGMTDPRLARLFARWYDAEKATLARDVLIPFGFTPDDSSASGETRWPDSTPVSRNSESPWWR